MTDKRRALGDGSAASSNDGNMPYCGPGENRLPGPYPHDRHCDAEPEIPYSGTPNPAICSNRPIADMNPNHGSGDIYEGTAFRIPMGKPGYDDPDYN